MTYPLTSTKAPPMSVTRFKSLDSDNTISFHRNPRSLLIRVCHSGGMATVTISVEMAAELRDYLNTLLPAPKAAVSESAPQVRPTVGSWVRFNPACDAGARRLSMAGLLMQVMQDVGTSLPFHLRVPSTSTSVEYYIWADLSEVTPWVPTVGDTVALTQEAIASLSGRYTADARFFITRCLSSGLFVLTPCGLQPGRVLNCGVTLADIYPVS